MALREIFAQDDDFKESMFARQMAVMKGQAWNVVETLKEPDHGPLELTRRARVCVWDDLVDVPIAIPLRVPSTETQKRLRDYDEDVDGEQDEEEEMDIGAATSSKTGGPDADLLGLSSSGSDLPHPGRFELTGSHNSETPTRNGSVDGASPARGSAKGLPAVPQTARQSGDQRSHRKQSSVSSGRGVFWDGDDIEGDLGYAAAQGMEGNQRKVIVERLEAVKSKNPVFTWC